MIRVNLLPEERKTRTTTKAQKVRRDIPYTWIAIGLVVALIVCAGLGFYHVYAVIDPAETVQNQIDMINREIKTLKLDVAKVEKVKAQRNELNNKLAIIDKLKTAQTGPVHLLDQLANSMPNRVWITKMTETGSQMVIDGKALEHSAISRFMQNLEKSPLFQGVELTTAVTDGKGGRGEETKTFHLSCRIDSQGMM